MIGEHVLRHAGGCLIDTPDQPAMPRQRDTWLWRYVAIVWPDTYQPDGWSALLWRTGERGWYLPATLAVGDVLEFGVAVVAHDLHKVAEHRWWGWLDHSTDRALIVHGPYTHPDDAHRDARRIIDDVRLAQLAGPRLVELDGSRADDSR
jgi:hypothetical protein